MRLYHPLLKIFMMSQQFHKAFRILPVRRNNRQKFARWQMWSRPAHTQWGPAWRVMSPGIKPCSLSKGSQGPKNKQTLKEAWGTQRAVQVLGVCFHGSAYDRVNCSCYIKSMQERELLFIAGKEKCSVQLSRTRTAVVRHLKNFCFFQ